jgi:hypothetical protein
VGHVAAAAAAGRVDGRLDGRCDEVLGGDVRLVGIIGHVASAAAAVGVDHFDGGGCGGFACRLKEKSGLQMLLASSRCKTGVSGGSVARKSF